MKSVGDNEFNNVNRVKKFIIINETALRKLTDDDIKKLFLATRTKINRCKRTKKNSKFLEIDMCYIQREIQNRRLFGKFQ